VRCVNMNRVARTSSPKIEKQPLDYIYSRMTVPLSTTGYIEVHVWMRGVAEISMEICNAEHAQNAVTQSMGKSNTDSRNAEEDLLDDRRVERTQKQDRLGQSRHWMQLGPREQFSSKSTSSLTALTTSAPSRPNNRAVSSEGIRRNRWNQWQSW